MVRGNGHRVLKSAWSGNVLARMFHCMPSPGPRAGYRGSRLGLPAGCGSICREPLAAVAGEISEYVAPLVVTKTRHLDARTRRDVDAE